MTTLIPVGRPEVGADPSRLKPLLEPASVALIGATPKEEGGILGAAVGFGFGGRLYPVNPRHESILGLKCYPSIADVPETVDLAFIAVSTESAERVVEDCIAAGARSIVVHAAGFAEFGPEGARIQARIKAHGARAGVPILGPNCQGVVNVEQRSCLSSNAIFRAYSDMAAGPVALASQSGGVGGILVAMLREVGVGVRYWVSTGNEGDVDVAEVLSYLLEKEEVLVGCAFIESVRNPLRWRRLAARAAELGKRVVVLHGGVSEAGAKASQSHTAALAGSQATTHAFLSQIGVSVVSDLPQLVLATSIAAAHGNLPSPAKVALIANAGGAGVILADECQRQGLPLADLASETIEALGRELPAFVLPNNPLDIPLLIGRDPDLIRRVMGILARDPNPPDVVVVCLHSVFDAPWGAAFNVPRTISGLVDAKESGGARLLCVFLSGDANVVALARDRGLTAFSDATTTIRGLAALAGTSGSHKQRPSTSTSASAAGQLPPKQATGGVQALSEAATKDRLKAAGLPVPRGGLARSPEEAAELAETIGFPVVLKLSSPDLPHKSDVGAVRLNLRTRGEVIEAGRAVIAAGQRALGRPATGGILVEEMVSDGLEMIAGIRRDPNLGPTLLLGLGGIYVEVFRTFALRVLPVTKDELLEMIRESDFFPLLSGSRGRPEADIDALASFLCDLAAFIEDQGSDIVQLDLNPLAVRPAGLGVSVLDALAYLEDAVDESGHAEDRAS